MNRYKLLGYLYGRKIRQKLEDLIVFILGYLQYTFYRAHYKLQALQNGYYSKSISYFNTLDTTPTSGSYTVYWDSKESTTALIQDIVAERKKKTKKKRKEKKNVIQGKRDRVQMASSRKKPRRRK